MYIAICDDQIEELENLTGLLQRWQEAHNCPLHYRTFRSAAALLDAAEKESFTLYLLDILMPGIDGLAAAREIRTFDTAGDLVFLTSSPNFAYESYGVHALDYLLKPTRAEMLFPILDRVFLREQKLQDGLLLKNGAVRIRVPFSQLVYVETFNKSLYFHLSDGQQYKISGTLKDYDALLLTQPEFMRIGRSYIVNILHIRELSPAGITTFLGSRIPIPRRLYPQIQKDYMKLLFSRGEV